MKEGGEPEDAVAPQVGSGDDTAVVEGVQLERWDVFAMGAPVVVCLAALVWCYLVFGLRVAALSLLCSLLVAVGFRVPAFLALAAFVLTTAIPVVVGLAMWLVLFPARWLLLWVAEMWEGISLLRSDELKGSALVPDAGSNSDAFPAGDRLTREAPAADDPTPWRPRVVNGVALVVSGMCLVLVLTTAFSVTLRRTEVRQLEDATEYLDKGNFRLAIGEYMRVMVAHDTSFVALRGLACSLWDIGYQDPAVWVFHAMLTAGERWGDGGDTGCFIEAPQQAGLAVPGALGNSLMYPVPASGDAAGNELVSLLADVESSGDDAEWQAHQLVSCMFDRFDMRLSASTHLSIALRKFQKFEAEGVEPVRVVDIPKYCADSADQYVVREGEGGLLASPVDFEERLFNPVEDPVPSRGGRILPRGGS